MTGGSKCVVKGASADLEAWRDWRTHLYDAQDPNVADAETRG